MRLEQWASLPELYRRELRENGYQSDPAQLVAVAALSDLRQRTADKSLRLLRSVLRRAPRPPEPGLYLWGAVGRGKTWLMDMFYDSLPFAQKRWCGAGCLTSSSAAIAFTSSRKSATCSRICA